MNSPAARMVDVGAKPATRREAVARGRVSMSAEAARMLGAGTLPKGDALAVARVAGIMAAKRTSDIVPLCHPLALDSVAVELEPLPDGVAVKASVRCRARTGAEMEALTAVCAACLTVYDMAKSVDPTMTVGPVYLEEKRGGRSGHYRRPAPR